MLLYIVEKLLKDEGMFLGNSAGAAIKGVLQLANESLIQMI